LGNSGGLLASWDPSIYEYFHFLTIGGMLLIGKCLKNNRILAILNMYGPCSDRIKFWKSIEDNGILTIKNLIIAGDLNLVLYPDKV